LLVGLTGGAVASAAGQAPERALSDAEHALFRGYRTALEEPSVRETSYESLLLQIRRNPPVAFVNGFWVTPVDLAAVLGFPAVHNVLEASLPEGPAGEEAATLLADSRRLKQLAAFAFTPKSLAAPAGLPFVGDFAQVRASHSETTDLVIVPVKDVDWAMVEYLPPGIADPEIEPECYFYCGDPEGWDFDGDGTPDRRDPDGDNDGAPNERDAYPYWPNASTCDCDADPFVVFVTKFAPGITSAILAARDLAEGIGEANRSVVLGPVPDGEYHVRFVFPTDAMPRADPARDCPPRGEAGVRYVNTDPAVCARLRFRCREGEVGFSNECGCGCQRRRDG
jgi:hypothetical protein